MTINKFDSTFLSLFVYLLYLLNCKNINSDRIFPNKKRLICPPFHIDYKMINLVIRNINLNKEL
jgi:hypothetical protein